MQLPARFEERSEAWAVKLVRVGVGVRKAEQRGRDRVRDIGCVSEVRIGVGFSFNE